MAAKVSFYRVNANRLASLPIREGQIIVTQDTGVLYIDTTNTKRARIGDINTTYSLTQDSENGHILTFTPSVGEASTITIPDNNDNTTYTLTQDENDNHKLIFTPSVGEPTIITIPDNDTTYSKATASADGLMSKEHYSKLEGIAAGANKTTVDSALSTSSTNPVQNKVIKNALDQKLNTSLKGANNGLAELDADGKVPSSQLPSYVDDVIEYAQKSNFPTTGEAGKIYISQNDNKTYRWSGSAYVEISSSLALGTTSSTAFRGDYGNSAYAHAVTNKGAAFASGLYKITTNAEGHVTAATAVQKSDITALGIPDSDTNTWTKVSTSADGYITKLPGNTTSFLRGDGTWATPNYPTSLNLKTVELTNQNLNEQKTPNFYYAEGGNTVTNKPSGVDTFGMIVYKSALNNIIQELTAGNQNAKKKYIRQWTGTAWDDWTEMKYTDTNTWTKVSTTADGYISKLSGSTTQWLNGNGAWSTPTAANVGAVAKTGDTMTGALNFANNVYNKFGDDVEIGDQNKAGHLQIHGLNGATGILFNPYSGDTSQGISINGSGKMTITENVTVEKEIESGTGVYKFGNSAIMQYNSTDECIDFIFA